MEKEGAQPALNILVVDDEANIRKTLSIGLEADGHHVIAVSNPADAIAEAHRRSFDLALIDLRLGAAHGMDLIPALMAESPWLRIVIITAHGTIDSAVEAMKRGASDYLTKPFTPAQVKVIVDREAKFRALQLQVAGLEDQSGASEDVTNLQSASPAMQRAINLARQVAETDANVLIRGESGTGKGLLAKAIHAWSKRSGRPFATISCPSLSSQLLESELFGHTKGAFTGAIRDNPGRITTTSEGTLFLDEIGDLPLELQPKLLRFVQDKEFERVGDSISRHADVRIISATNIDLEAAVKAKRFREDLLFRLNVVQIHIPPLRERPEDLISLAETILHARRESRNITGFSAEAQAVIRSYDWPGNVRELRNAIEHALIFCRSEQIGAEYFPANLAPRPPSIQVGDPVSLDQIEEMHIRRVLATSKSLDDAAETLGIDLATLWRRRRKYQI